MTEIILLSFLSAPGLSLGPSENTVYDYEINIQLKKKADKPLVSSGCLHISSFEAKTVNVV